MKHYKIVLEMELDSDTPLEAAKEMEHWVQDKSMKFTYVVQDDQTNEVFTVDLGEDDEDAVLLDSNHQPLIS